MKEKEIYDINRHDLTKLSREELYEEVKVNQNFAINALAKVDWIIGAFMSTLETDLNFGKQRMRKVLKGVSDRFRLYSEWPYCGEVNFLNYLEKFNYHLYFKHGQFLLRDLECKEVYDDLAANLEELAQKIRYGKELTDDDRKILGILREVEDG